MTNEFFDMGDTHPREKYMLVDISNHMHRHRHGSIRAGNTTEDDINQYTLHLGISGLNKLYNEIAPTKIVGAIDHGSWRKKVLPMYKARRKEGREKDTGFASFMETMQEFQNMLREYSSVICLEEKYVEADDWIARWIQTHPDDDHVIVSTDADFYQLHAENVTQYNPVAKKWIQIEDPKWEIFLKCMRGETGATSDNIPSAFPRVPVKKLKLAFYGDVFVMENIMQHEVPNIAELDDDGIPIMTITQQLFDRNAHLMNLTMQPPEIIDQMDAIIKTAEADVGRFDMFQMLRYLGSHELHTIVDRIDSYIPMLRL